MALPHISESEWILMEALWNSSPQTAPELTRVLEPTRHWAGSTVRILFTRLAEKGALKTGQNAASTRTYRPAVSREACLKVEGESFLQRLFRGAAQPLLAHFAQNSRLSPEAVEELKRLLDQSMAS